MGRVVQASWTPLCGAGEALEASPVRTEPRFREQALQASGVGLGAGPSAALCSVALAPVLGEPSAVWSWCLLKNGAPGACARPAGVPFCSPACRTVTAPACQGVWLLGVGRLGPPRLLILVRGTALWCLHVETE